MTKQFRSIVQQRGFVLGLRSLLFPVTKSATVVHDVSFTVHRGELVTLLGPNGAGKSTTIKMLTGILRPTSGTVEVAGISPHLAREHNARNVGAVFGQRTQLWWDLPARQSLEILRDIFEVEEADYRRRLGEFDDLLRLSDFWDTRVRHLSLGQRVRCDLAAALLHDPMVIFLDEPTIGMDVVVKEQVRDFLRQEVQHRGRTVLLTTHDMTEVDRLAERTMLINHGRLMFDGSLAELRRRFGGGWQIHVTFAEPVPEPSVRGLDLLHRNGPRAVFGPGAGDGAQPGAAGRLTAYEAIRGITHAYAVADVVVKEDDLEDVIREAYQRQFGQAADGDEPRGSAGPVRAASSTAP